MRIEELSDEKAKAFYNNYFNDYLKREEAKIMLRLVALRIIIEHNLDIDMFRCSKNYTQYKAQCKQLFIDCEISKIEYEAIKKVVGWYDELKYGGDKNE